MHTHSLNDSIKQLQKLSKTFNSRKLSTLETFNSRNFQLSKTFNSRNMSSTTGPVMWFIPYLHAKATEGWVYAVLKNAGFGFLSKTKNTTHSDGTVSATKAVTLIERKGRNGKPDFKSAIIGFDFLFTRGDDNAGNVAIHEWLKGGSIFAEDGTEEQLEYAPVDIMDTLEQGERFVANHIQIEYQSEGYNEKTGRDESAYYWKAYMYRKTHSSGMTNLKEKPAPRVGNKKPKVTFVSARAPIQMANRPVEAPPLEVSEGFQTVGSDGKTK